MENIHKVKLSTPDYRGMNDDKAIDDFKQRRGGYLFFDALLDSQGRRTVMLTL